MKRFHCIFLILLLSQSLLATEQIRDSLVYNGKGYYIEKQFEMLFEDELREFVEEKNLLPEDFFYTSLWRRYIAVFEIVDNRLLLKELNALVHNEKDSTAHFQNIVTIELQEKIKALEFNGVLILADEIDDYSFFNPDNIFNPNYKIIEFKKSIVSKELDFQFKEMDGFKNIQFEKYKKTKFYRIDFRNCRKRKKESIKHFIKTNQLEMVKYERTSNCNGFIKAFLFENPHYQTIF